MDINTFRGVITAVLFVLFIGLVFWAYSGKRKADFDAAARLAVDEDIDTAPSQESAGEKH